MLLGSSQLFFVWEWWWQEIDSLQGQTYFCLFSLSLDLEREEDDDEEEEEEREDELLLEELSELPEDPVELLDELEGKDG